MLLFAPQFALPIEADCPMVSTEYELCSAVDDTYSRQSFYAIVLKSVEHSCGCHSFSRGTGAFGSYKV